MVILGASVSSVHFHGLSERREVVSRSAVLQSMAAHLRRHAAPLCEGPTFVPEEKALLSRDGGVCAQEGSRLAFDPLSPHEHRCPVCHSVYTGERHYRAWVWRYHLWLSERAIHLAVLGALDQDRAALARAAAIVEAYSQRYRHYPNRDNVLGPTRPFFSTYLESVWLTQLIIALELIRRSGLTPTPAATGAVDEMIEESASLIGLYDEWWSNRQVWNNVALIAAGRHLGDRSFLTRGISGQHGLIAQLKRAVSSDGRWVEGENYHLFALHGFVLGAALLEDEGFNLYASPSTSQLGRMFTAPLTTLLPDLTLPARGDSPFGVSVLQPRFAELWEVGWARTGDRRLESLLAEMYAAQAPEGPDIGLEEIAELESNRPASRVRRDRLGWKALLWMRPESPDVDVRAWRSGSVLVSPDGPVVMRPNRARYIGLECSSGPNGHGHPDALHLTLVDGRPWFQDFGTGSYVSPTLHWFRSALCHNAPVLVGIGQRHARGWCSAFDQVGEWAWARGSAPEIFGPQYTASRTVIAGPNYILDVVHLAAPDDSVVDLPIHPLGTLSLPDDVTVKPTSGLEVYGALGHESGYGAIENAVVASHVPNKMLVRGDAGETLELYMAPREEEQLFIARAPGPPTPVFGESGPLDFLVRRAAGSGRWVQVYTTRPGAVSAVEIEGEEVRVLSGEKADRFHFVTHGLDAVLMDGTVLHLGGILPQPSYRISGPQIQPVRLRCALLDREVGLRDAFDHLPPAAIVSLGALSYRRSERDYPGEASFSARVGLGACGTRIYVLVDVLKGTLVFRDHDAPDLGLDNETSDIHADGVQCYFAWDAWSGYLVLPQSNEPTVRVHEVAGTAARPGRLQGTWAKTPTGYRILLTFDVGESVTVGREFSVNVVVNEMQEDRVRRAGQLALAGGGGWVYLRGDRESESDAAVAVIQ